MNQQLYLDTAVAIAREAGALLMAGFGQQTEIEHKSSAVDWVTQYDTAAEQLILQRLTAAFPDHGIIGEEGGQRAGAGQYVWHVDPLDGTNNFAHGYPVFCVSIALYQGDAPLVGVVYDPTRDECFTAVAGQGAYLTCGSRRQRLQVTERDDLGRSLLATGFPYDRQTNPDNNLAQLSAFLKASTGVRRAGAAALDIASVAAGRLDGYWEFKLNTWDVAAACLLVQEAGGQVTTVDGGELVMRPFLSLVASNGRIHQRMLHVLASV